MTLQQKSGSRDLTTRPATRLITRQCEANSTEARTYEIENCQIHPVHTGACVYRLEGLNQRGLGLVIPIIPFE